MGLWYDVFKPITILYRGHIFICLSKLMVNYFLAISYCDLIMTFYVAHYQYIHIIIIFIYYYIYIYIYIAMCGLNSVFFNTPSTREKIYFGVSYL